MEGRNYIHKVTDGICQKIFDQIMPASRSTKYIELSGQGINKGQNKLTDGWRWIVKLVFNGNVRLDGE